MPSNGLDTELIGFTCRVGDLGCVQECLGRYAPPVQACASEFVGIDKDDGLAEFCCSESAGVSAAASTENDDVCLGHRSHSCSGFGALILPPSPPAVNISPG